MDADRDILACLDEHMARGNEHMARGNELMEEIREEHRLNREVYAQGMKMIFDLSERQERFMNEAIAEMVGAFREIRTEIREDLRLVRERMEAQTEAIFRMLDRLDGNGGDAAA